MVYAVTITPRGIEQRYPQYAKYLTRYVQSLEQALRLKADFESADEAFEYLKTELRPGDSVLVKSSNAAGLRFLGDRLGESFS